METIGTTSFLPATAPYNDPTFSLIFHIQFIFEILGLLYIISKSKSMVISQLDTNQRILDQKTSQLETQTKELLEKTNELEGLKSKLMVINENLSTYAATTAHDLKQPIRTMVSFAALLKNELKDNSSEKVSEYLDFIVTGGKDMTNQVEKVLDIANLSKEIVFTSIDPKKIIDNTVKMLDSQIKQANAEIEIQEIPNQIIAHEVSIKKVFQNIISNGIKFNNKEKVKIEISGSETPSEWLFSIKDNGIGIKKKNQSEIFNYGVRESSKVEGTGVGLSICDKLINLHKGKIRIKSTIGIGTEFIFSINKNLQI